MINTARKGSYSGGKSILIIDERASGGTLRELPAPTCANCGITVILNKYRERPRGKCIRCSKYICDDCQKLGECNYIEEMIELALAHPDQGPFLLRGPHGEILFDPELRDRKRLH